MTKQGQRWNSPAVERHLVTPEMNVSVFKYLHHLGKKSPKKSVRFSQDGIDWTEQAVGPIPIVVTRRQQIILSIAPRKCMP